MKKVAVIQDMSSFGKCSLTAAMPVLSVMGMQAVPLPTAILTAQTGYSSFYCEDLTSRMDYFMDEWSKLGASFDGIHTGFVTGKEQIDNIFRFLGVFHSTDTTLLVDPVMGDHGEVYKMFTGDLLERMKELVKCADIITPNVTECCLLTGLSFERMQSYQHEIDYIQVLEEAGQQLQQATGAKVIITGLNPPTAAGKRYVGNMFVDAERSFHSIRDYNGESYSGTGDLFASVIMGGMMRGQDLVESMKLAETFLAAAIEATSKEQVPREAGVHFEQFLRMLL
ncbi:pyridoxamine kinase [Lysinibacillus sphaericus]|nr:MULTISPECIES: pyridoxamine kinase [Lysinibacillus]MBE5084398.1 pyridoxamine kinase [Bacillus thuringiensis]AMO32297.1 pyridoxine kinase [Lysinibacillus sphaericus]AMR92604.1 pyridoxine kinase [Lysinibacillus sphaericus]ANA46653.1 pyridoxine kinase [Lysinibacillus sphaericus]KZL46066.1 pyridoxine kinase [Lysinibacillus sphaericus]